MPTGVGTATIWKLESTISSTLLDKTIFLLKRSSFKDESLSVTTRCSNDCFSWVLNSSIELILEILASNALSNSGISFSWMDVINISKSTVFDAISLLLNVLS